MKETRKRILERTFERGSVPINDATSPQFRDWTVVSSLGQFKNEREMLRHYYIEKDLSLAAISDILKVPTSTLAYRLRKYEIPIRSRGGNSFKHAEKRLNKKLTLMNKSLKELIREHGSEETVSIILDIPVRYIYAIARREK